MKTAAATVSETGPERDFVLARIAAARSRVENCDSQLQELIDHITDPSSSGDDEEIDVVAALEFAELLLRDAVSSIQLGTEVVAAMDPAALLTGEPEDDEDLEDDEDEDDEE